MPMYNLEAPLWPQTGRTAPEGRGRKDIQSVFMLVGGRVGWEHARSRDRGAAGQFIVAVRVLPMLSCGELGAVQELCAHESGAGQIGAV